MIARLVVWLCGATLCCVGCGKALQVNLVISDPCDNQVLLGAKQVQVDVSAPGVPATSTTWSASSGRGALKNLPLAADATLAVTLRGESAALAAGSVSPLDLSGRVEKDLVAVNVVVGFVDAFYQTTNTSTGVTCTALGSARREHTATLLFDGRILIVGGEKLERGVPTYWQTTELYDPKTGTFAAGPNMAGWTRKGHTATRLRDGRVLVAAGVGVNNDSLTTWKAAQLFDATSNSFGSLTLHMQEPRAYHTATLLDDGRVLIAGGTADDQVLATTEIYDPSSNTFAAGPTLLQARAHHAAVKVGKSAVAIIGGQNATRALVTVEFVTLNPDEVSLGPELLVARSYPAVEMVPGGSAIVVAGGFDKSVTSAEVGVGVASAEIIKIERDLAASSLPCPSVRLAEGRGAAAIAAIDRGVVIMGGIAANGQVLSSAERITITDLPSCAVVVGPSAGSMYSSRAGAVVTPLLGGDSLVSGGFTQASTNATTLALVEVYVHPR